MRILLVAGRHPFPPRRGDELRALQCAGALATRHQVTLLVPEAPSPAATPADLPFRVETCSRRRTLLPVAMVRSLLTGLPLQNAFFSYPALARRVAELRSGVDLVVLQLVRLQALLTELHDTPVVADLIDSLSLNFRSRADRDRRFMALPLQAEARRVARCEERLVERASVSLVVSDRDRHDLERRLSPALGARLRTVPIAMGGYPQGEPVERPGRERRDDTIVFSGNFGYFVNRDALRWFLARVWPALRRERPRLRLLAAGSRCPEALRREIARVPGVELLDDPADLRAVLASATVAVAPLQCGSGVPIKVLEAWSAGTPVVASPWGAAGVDGAGALEVAETPEQWLDALARLLDTPERRTTLAAAGRLRVASRYSPEAVRLGFLECVDAAVPAGERALVAGSR